MYPDVIQVYTIANVYRSPSDSELRGLVTRESLALDRFAKYLTDVAEILIHVPHLVMRIYNLQLDEQTSSTWRIHGYHPANAAYVRVEWAASNRSSPSLLSDSGTVNVNLR